MYREFPQIATFLYFSKPQYPEFRLARRKIEHPTPHYASSRIYPRSEFSAPLDSCLEMSALIALAGATVNFDPLR
jgi:hypothetical protein